MPWLFGEAVGASPEVSSCTPTTPSPCLRPQSSSQFSPWSGCHWARRAGRGESHEKAGAEDGGGCSPRSRPLVGFGGSSCSLRALMVAAREQRRLRRRGATPTTAVPWWGRRRTVTAGGWRGWGRSECKGWDWEERNARGLGAVVSVFAEAARERKGRKSGREGTHRWRWGRSTEVAGAGGVAGRRRRGQEKKSQIRPLRSVPEKKLTVLFC